MMGKTFGDLLLETRKGKGYSLKEVSELLNGEITPSYINRLENKHKENPSFTVVCELAKALEMNMTEIFSSFGYEDISDSELQAGGSEDICQGSPAHADIDYLPQAESDRLLKETVGFLFDYAKAEERDSYGHLPKIIGHAEKYRQHLRATK